MGNNFLVPAMIGLAMICGLLAVLSVFLKNKKFLYAVPAVIGAGALSVGVFLFEASLWRAIAAGALIAGAACISVSVFLFVRHGKGGK